jgi:hypothetical protein
MLLVVENEMCVVSPSFDLLGELTTFGGTPSRLEDALNELYLDFGFYSRFSFDRFSTRKFGAVDCGWHCRVPVTGFLASQNCLAGVAR